MEVPISRQIVFEVPAEMPEGRVRVSITPVTETPKVVPLLSLRGSCKGLDTMDAYFERKRGDKALEDRNYEQKVGTP